MILFNLFLWNILRTLLKFDIHFLFKLATIKTLLMIFPAFIQYYIIKGSFPLRLWKFKTTGIVENYLSKVELCTNLPLNNSSILQNSFSGFSNTTFKKQIILKSIQSMFLSKSKYKLTFLVIRDFFKVYFITHEFWCKDAYNF